MRIHFLFLALVAGCWALGRVPVGGLPSSGSLLCCLALGLVCSFAGVLQGKYFGHFDRSGSFGQNLFLVIPCSFGLGPLGWLALPPSPRPFLVVDDALCISKTGLTFVSNIFLYRFHVSFMAVTQGPVQAADIDGVTLVFTL